MVVSALSGSKGPRLCKLQNRVYLWHLQMPWEIILFNTLFCMILVLTCVDLSLLMLCYVKC